MLSLGLGLSAGARAWSREQPEPEPEPTIDPPVNTVAPVVSGTPKEGETLSVTTGSWGGTLPLTFAYQWLRNGNPISGATSPTYTCVAEDEGAMISCSVTATNGAGSVSAVSNAVGPVEALPEPEPEPEPEPTIFSGLQFGLNPATDGRSAPSGLAGGTHRWSRTGWFQRNAGAGTAQTFFVGTGGGSEVWAGIYADVLTVFFNWGGSSLTLGPVAPGEKFYFGLAIDGTAATAVRRSEGVDDWVVETATLSQFTPTTFMEGRSPAGEPGYFTQALERWYSVALTESQLKAESSSEEPVVTPLSLTWEGNGYTEVDIAFNIALEGGSSPDPDPDPVDPESLVIYPFAKDSPWNQEIDLQTAIIHGPAHPKTARIRSNTGGNAQGPDEGPIEWALNIDNYAIATYYAKDTDPLVRIIDSSGGDRWVHCPADAVPAPGSDAHMCIVDPDGLHSHDMWLASRNGNVIQTASYVKVRLDAMGWRMHEERLRDASNPRGLNLDNAVDGNGGPRAVSAALLGGLIRVQHLIDGEIPHALVMAIPRRWAKGGLGVRVFPADEIIGWCDGDESTGSWQCFSGDIVYSDRFILDPSLDVDSLPVSREWKIIMKAMQKYGIFMGDVAGKLNPCIYAEWPGVQNQYGNAIKNQQALAFSYIVPNLHYVEWL